MPYKDKSYTDNRAGAVSKNIFRLRKEAELTRPGLASEAGVTAGIIDKFETSYEPPTNHPFIPKISKALSRVLNRDVSKELLEGGSEWEFSKHQLARIYGGNPDAAPAGYFAKGKAVRPGKRKYQRLLDFLNTDKRVATLAKQFNMALPNAKVGYNDQPIGQGPRAIRERAYRLIRKLEQEGVEVRKLAEGKDVAPASNPSSNGRSPGKDLRSVVYTAVSTFNQRRTLGERTMVMPMDAFELFFGDYLKQSGISSNVLIGADINKLIPKG